MVKKSSVAAAIHAAIGAEPNHIAHSCGITGQRRPLRKNTKILGIDIGHGVDKISGEEVHSPAMIEFEGGEIGVTTTGALAGGNLGVRMTPGELNVLAIKRLKGQGCKIIGPDGGAINLD
jgi:hypothetical protein